MIPDPPGADRQNRSLLKQENLPSGHELRGISRLLTGGEHRPPDRKIRKNNTQVTT